MAFGVATHVALSHLDMQRWSSGRPAAIIVMAIAFGLALALRLSADASENYFRQLGWASALWIFGSGVWLISLGPKMLRRQTG
jgi:hypothetical protein